MARVVTIPIGPLFMGGGCRGLIHVIKQGDTLYKLGKQYHVSVSSIMYANPYVNIYNLQIGDELCIPVAAPRPLPAEPMPLPADARPVPVSPMPFPTGSAPAQARSMPQMGGQIGEQMEQMENREEMREQETEGTQEEDMEF